MGMNSRHMADFLVAGFRHWDGALVLDKLAVGKKLALKLEADNPHDPDAVALYRKGVKLGYIPRDENQLPAQLLRFGHGDVFECRILKVDVDTEPWRQVRVGLYMTDKTGSKA